MRAGYAAWLRADFFFMRYELLPGEGELWPRFRLSYSWGGEERVQVVPVVSTVPNYGGRRRWFLCPGCLRRSATLHHPGGDSEFSCRLCHDLTYESARLSGSLPRWLFLREAKARGIRYSAARDDIRRRIGGRVHETRYLHI